MSGGLYAVFTKLSAADDLGAISVDAAFAHCGFVGGVRLMVGCLALRDSGSACRIELVGPICGRATD